MREIRRLVADKEETDGRIWKHRRLLPIAEGCVLGNAINRQFDSAIFGEWREHLVAETEIQRETRVDPEVILSVKAGIKGAHSQIDHGIALHGCGCSKEEIGHRVAGDRAVEGEDPGIEVSGLQDPGAIVQIDAKAEIVPPLDLVQSVANLPVFTSFDPVTNSRTADSKRSRNTDRGRLGRAAENEILNAETGRRNGG